MTDQRNKTIALAVSLLALAAAAGFFVAPAARAQGVSVTVDTDLLDPVDAVVEKAVEPVLREVMAARQAVEEMKRIGEDAAKV
ncbi:MAG: hypothetical protein AB1896_10085, partial [Thermodesulfobacteriota bacterium]